MGYCIELTKAKFAIKAEQKARALAALKALLDRTDLMTGESWSGGMKTGSWFAFCDGLADATTLAEAMEAIRWPITEDSDGNVVGIEFSGEKLGDDRHLLMALAPFVEDGSTLEMVGEDHNSWAWDFVGGRLL